MRKWVVTYQQVAQLKQKRVCWCQIRIIGTKLAAISGFAVIYTATGVNSAFHAQCCGSLLLGSASETKLNVSLVKLTYLGLN